MAVGVVLKLISLASSILIRCPGMRWRMLRHYHLLFTCSRAERDLLMCCASFNCSPTTPDLPTRSDPAKSTKCSLPLRSTPSDLGWHHREKDERDAQREQDAQRERDVSKIGSVSEM